MVSPQQRLSRSRHGHSHHSQLSGDLSSGGARLPMPMLQTVVRPPSPPALQCSSPRLTCLRQPSTPEATRRGLGAVLLRKPTKLARLVSGIVAGSDLPVTVKIRMGENDSKINAPAVAELMERAGAAAVTIHGRTMEQRCVAHALRGRFEPWASPRDQ